MYSQCDSDHAGDLLVSSDRERECTTLSLQAGDGGSWSLHGQGGCCGPADRNSILATMWRVRRCWLLPVAGAEAGLLHLVINSWGSDGSHVQLCSFVPTKGGKGVMFIYVLREGWELCSYMY